MATVEEHPATNGTATAAGDIAVENPATGEVIAHVPDTTPEQVAELARAARAAQPAWEALGFEGRARILRRAQKWVVDNSERVIETIVSETGKAYEDALIAEVMYAANAFGFWAKHAPVLPGRRARQERLAAAQGQEARPALPAARPRRRHRPVELPADELVRRRHPGARRGQRGPAQAQRGDAADEPAAWPTRCASAACPTGSSRSPPGAAATGAALVDEVDMIMFTGSTATGQEGHGPSGRDAHAGVARARRQGSDGRPGRRRRRARGQRTPSTTRCSTAGRRA